MNRSEFGILVTNVTAIANQVFSIQCGELGSALAADDSNDFSTPAFDLNTHLSEFDFQSVINCGYDDLETVATDIDAAWSNSDTDTLSALLEAIPSELPTLSSRLSGDALKEWIRHTTLSAEKPSDHSSDHSSDPTADEPTDESPFYALHQYVMSFFEGGDMEDDIGDVIREAIAFDELETLLAQKNQVTAKHITLDDLITASTIQSFKVFEWLYDHAELDDQAIETLLSNCLDDKTVFEKTYDIVSPNSAQHKTILRIASERENVVALDYLQQKN